MKGTVRVIIFAIFGFLAARALLTGCNRSTVKDGEREKRKGEVKVSSEVSSEAISRERAVERADERPEERGIEKERTRDTDLGTTDIDADLPPRVPNRTCRFEPLPKVKSYGIAKAFEKLRFSRPLFLTYAPDGSDRIFVVEQPGRILVFPNDPKVKSYKVFLDIRKKVSSYGEEGLLGLAFHPRYRDNGYFYIYYSAPKPRRSVVARYQVSKGDPDRADPNSEKILMEIAQPYSNHNGGMMAFGPDGYLYISLGDGGAAGDPHNNSQNLKTLLGSILRIDVDNRGAGKNYAIPPDNPFAGRKDARPEIWAYGLRNVWRFSFDRFTGRLWAADVGQDRWEEVDIIVKGGNYGWRVMEGNQCYNPPKNCNKSGFIPPVVVHNRKEARSLIGGYVYRGSSLKSLFGAYIYGDFITGNTWALFYDEKKVVKHFLLVSTKRNISSFGEDRDGELYFTAFDGYIYKFTENRAAPIKVAKTLQKTGCFDSLKPLTPNGALIGYSVVVPQWTGKLEKERWIALPNLEKIEFSEKGAWKFPDGTAIIQHLYLLQKEGDVGSKKPVETRILYRDGAVWRPLSYRWKSDGTDAELVTAEAKIELKQMTKEGREVKFEHYFYPPSKCLHCHNQKAGYILGVNTSQLNRKVQFLGRFYNQLALMEKLDLFTKPLPKSPAALPRLAALNDSGEKLKQRVGSYLSANCGQCHRGGKYLARGKLDLSVEQFAKSSCGILPRFGMLGINGGKIVTPQKPEKSILL